jgi:RNA polymerase sigma factor (TIGR02999 family)
VSHILDETAANQSGLPRDTEQLFGLVYQELRRLAAHKMGSEAEGHTLQPTALVHEAWLRLAGEGEKRWQSRAQFFSAAGEAMRRILIERARRKSSLKRGANPAVEDLTESKIILRAPSDQMIAVHEALQRLATQKPEAAELVKLRYFVGMTLPEAAEALEMSLRSANRLWVYARAWLHREIEGDSVGE